MIIKAFMIAALIFALAACKQQVVSEAELKQYVLDPEHGLHKQLEKNDAHLEVLYRPSMLVAAQQVDGITDPKERSRTVQSFDSLTYFVLKMSRNGKEIENTYVSDNGRFTAVVNYLSSSIAQHIYLVTEGDTTRALDAVYARMFGAAEATSVMAVFNTDLRKKSGISTFHLEDTELGLGSNEFEFDINDIKKAPTLNLN